MFYFLYFLTSWSILFVILHTFTHKYIDLLYMTFIILVIGSYISFVRPKKFVYKIDNEEIVFKGLHKLIVVDIFAHLLPFLFIYYKYRTYYMTRDFPLYDPITILIILSYFVLIDTNALYGVDKYEIFLLFIVGTCLYSLL